MSTVQQITDGQEVGILTCAQARGLRIDEWVMEQASGHKRAARPEWDTLPKKLNAGDTLLIGEVSRLGRLMEVFSIPGDLVDRKVIIIDMKGGHQFDGSIASDFYAAALPLGACIEREHASLRAIDHAAMRKNRDDTLGRPKGSLNLDTKLTGKEDIVRGYLAIGLPNVKMAKQPGVDRRTIDHFIKTRLTPGTPVDEDTSKAIDLTKSVVNLWDGVVHVGQH